ncbi:MAG: Deoxycytidine monophosphate (dCMP) deaminase [Bathelium mastoideum]|nr:MAG: Deoxycytidine monophosphate (dCMP) deaminase [Bathelium mastoideum]
MLIGLCGGICAGKHSVEDSLVEKHDFQRISLARAVSTPAVEKTASDVRLPQPSAANAAHTFKDVDELLEFVTKRWQERWVTTDIWDETSLDSLLRRPFFLLVSVEAPVSVRWQRFRNKCLELSLSPPTLEQFVLRNDEHLYDPITGLAKLLGRAQVRLLNSSASIEGLQGALETLDLSDEKRLRPTWDQYFMQLASLAAQRSNCMKRRVGCVLVRERRVISTGYNGTPRGLRNCNEGGCPRCNGGLSSGVALSTCLCIHAEENALLEAGRERIREGSTLYCDTCPCLTCSIKITQVGISEVVYSQRYYMDTETAAVFREAGVRLRQFFPPRNGLVGLE